jgi:hypothetical protein
MNARAASSVALLALLLLAAAPRAQAGPWSLAPGEYYTQFLGGWSSSDGYHDAVGGRRFLVKGGLLEERSLLSYTEMGWKKKVSFVLGIPLRSVTRRFGAAGNQASLPTTTGLADGLIGFRYRLANGHSAAALEIDWKAPLSYDSGLRLTRKDSLLAGDANGDGDSLNGNEVRQLSRPTLGDGQNDVTISLHLGTQLTGRGFVQMAGGYRYRFQEPKDQVVLSGDLGLWLTRSLMIAGRYDGVVTSDDLTSKPGQELFGVGSDPADRLVRHRAGPMLIYRIDDHMDLIVNTMHTVTAKNALHTDEVYVGVAFRQTKLNRLQGFLGNLSNP